MSSPDEIERLKKNNPKLAKALEIVNGEVGKMERREENAKALLTRLLESPTMRPRSWSQGSNAPYYKKKYGMHVKKRLENFLLRHPLETDTRRFLIDASEASMSGVSYHQKILQGWRWLIENDIDKDKWAALRLKVFVGRKGKVISLCYKHDEEEEDNIKERSVDKVIVPRMTWKNELETFMAKGEDDQKLIYEDIDLLDTDIEYIKSLVDQSDGLFIKTLDNTGFTLIMNRKVKEEMRNL